MKINWTKQYASNINCTACPQTCQMKNHMSVASTLQQLKTSTWAWHPKENATLQLLTADKCCHKGMEIPVKYTNGSIAMSSCHSVIKISTSNQIEKSDGCNFLINNVL